MIFRKLLYLIILCLNLSILGAGGVDVGNGGVSRTVDVLVDQGFTTEGQLSNYLQSNIFDIERGYTFGLSILTRQYDCSDLIKVEEMDVTNHYPFEAGKIGTKEYQGLLKVRLENCKE